MSSENNNQSAFKELLDRYSADIRVSLMAEVIDCDLPTMSVTVKPLSKDRKMSETSRGVEYEDMQEIFDVPLAMVSGVQFMPDSGAHGLLVFHDFDLDEYKLSRERRDPASSRNHDYQDAIFVPIESAQVGRPEAYIQLYQGVCNIIAPGGIWLNGVNFEQHTHTNGYLSSPTGPFIATPPAPPIDC